MKEEFVTYNQAQALKTAGFDWECQHYYTKENAADDEVWLTSEDMANWNGKDVYPFFLKPLCSAPSLSIVAKWFREKFNWHISVEPEYDGTWYYHICPIGGANEDVDTGFKSYEDALSAGITEILKML